MRINLLAYSTLAVLLIVTGWLVGSRQAVEAQSVTNVCEWRMFSENVSVGSAGGGGDGVGWPGLRIYGTSWMYQSCTGEVRRMFDGCGDNYPDGCALQLPVLVVPDSTAPTGYQPNMKLMGR